MHKTKAGILAGGKGVRLGVISENAPKPLTYIGGPKTTIEYVFDKYVEAGMHHIFLFTQYMAASLEAAFGTPNGQLVYGTDVNPLPIQLLYSRPGPNQTFIETADAIRKSRVRMSDGIDVTDRRNDQRKRINWYKYALDRERYEIVGLEESYDTLLVGSGDGLFNFDLKRLLDFHRERGAVATVALYRMPKEKIVGNLGTAVIDESSGRILRFDEKPCSLEDVQSDWISTGIYVFDSSALYVSLEHNPDLLDFGKHVLPFLVRTEPQSVFGCCFDGYWNDVGTIPVYHSTNLELIDGIPGIDTLSHTKGRQKPTRNLGEMKHSISGQGIYIKQGSVVHNSVLGNDVRIGRNVELNECVIGKGVEIQDGFKGRRLILCEGVRIYEGAVIGADTVIGMGTVIQKGAKIHSKPGDYRQIGSGVVISEGKDVTEDIIGEKAI